MFAWIGSIVELMNVGRFGFNFSLPDARYFLPDARICGILLVYAAFCMFCIWDNTRPQDKHDHKSKKETK